MSDRLALLTSAPFREFLEQNKDADVARLLLSQSRPKEELREAADQIISRRKSRDKLPTWYSNQSILFPPPLSIEQSSSEEAAQYKKRLFSGNHLIDLTGGMGIDCLVLSENFDQTTYVEQNEWLCELFSHNSKSLGKSVGVVARSSEDFLQGFAGKAHFFIDPARRDDQKKKVFRFEDCSPNVISQLSAFKQMGERVLIKAAPLVDLTYGIESLKNVSEIHVLSIQNECKEVLFLLDFSFTGEPEIHCVNLDRGREEHFQFTQSREKATEVRFSDTLNYLYDPNASIRKAGAFKSIASTYDLSKLAPNTHLYTSDRLIKNFPGRVFKVECELSKSEIRKLFPEEKVNIISKNHPLSADQLSESMKLKSGGNDYLFAFRDHSAKPRLFKCNRSI